MRGTYVLRAYTTEGTLFPHAFQLHPFCPQIVWPQLVASEFWLCWQHWPISNLEFRVRGKKTRPCCVSTQNMIISGFLASICDYYSFPTFAGKSMFPLFDVGPISCAEDTHNWHQNVLPWQLPTSPTARMDSRCPRYDGTWQCWGLGLKGFQRPLAQASKCHCFFKRKLNFLQHKATNATVSKKRLNSQGTRDMMEIECITLPEFASSPFVTSLLNSHGTPMLTLHQQLCDKQTVSEA